MLVEIKEQMVGLLAEYVTLVTLNRLKEADKIVDYDVKNYVDELIVKFTIDGDTWLRLEVPVMSVITWDDVDNALVSVIEKSEVVMKLITGFVMRRRKHA